MKIFLDSNIYIREKYVFDFYKLGNLKELINRGKVTLLYTSVTFREVEKHMIEECDLAVKKYNRSISKDISPYRIDQIYGINKIEIEDAIAKSRENLTNFFNLSSVKKIPLNPLDAEKLIDDYYSKKPPFENKKPNEFKDAIAINALKKYQESIREPIYIISDDSGFLKAFSESNEYIVFNTLQDFLKYYNRNEEMDFINKAIDNEDFADKLYSYIDNYDIFMDSYEEYDINDRKISDITYEVYHIEKELEKKYASISCDIEFLIDITYRNEDMSYYDKEDREYLFENYIHAIETHKVNINFKVSYDIKNDTNKKLVLQKFEIIEDNHSKTIYLDENTMVSSEEQGNTLDEESDLEKCSLCGKVLYYDFLYQDYEGKPICEECMKSDEYGNICPECGRKIPNEYMIDGYCQNCFHMKDC